MKTDSETLQGDLDDDEAASPLTRAEKREAQALRILDAAKTCFVRSGFQGASMHEICREAGMSPGALYRYFPSKESIIEAIAAKERSHDAELLTESLAHPDIVEALVNSVMTQIRVRHETRMAPLFTEIRAEALRNPAVLESCECSMRQFREMIFRRVSTAVAEGKIRPTVPVETLLPVMVAIGEGLVLNDLPSKGLDLAQVETMIRTAVTANLRPVTS